jgi:hypothetical protein
MEGHDTPTFDEWVEYCFTRGEREFRDDPDLPAMSDPRASNRFHCMAPIVMAEYFIKLFESPGFVAERYTDDQVADGVWFIFGVSSGYFHDVFSEPVPEALQVRCMSSVLTMYTDLFDRVCCKHGADPEGPYADTLKVDGAVYMIWDMDCFEAPLYHPEKWPHLIDPAFAVLGGILAKCQTSSCLVSALHGLGHIRDHYPQRVKPIINRFLRHRHIGRRRIRSWLEVYAETAKNGCVQ